MERFLGDLLPVLATEGVEPAALVHAHDRPGGWQHPFPVWRVPAYGRLLCVGRLTYYKGHAVLLAALRPDDGIRLICVGAGEWLDPLRERARQRRLDVHFTGALSDARRNALLATCDVLVLPSVERTEAFGVVLLEAMAYGKPVIATRVPGSGMGWVVEEGVTGWLVPPGDAAALAQVLQAVRRCPVERRRRGEAGRVRLSRRYHIRTCARSLAAIYQEVCG